MVKAKMGVLALTALMGLGAVSHINGFTGAHQLLVLANLESYNAVLIGQGKKQEKRMELLPSSASSKQNAASNRLSPLNERISS